MQGAYGPLPFAQRRGGLGRGAFDLGFSSIERCWVHAKSTPPNLPLRYAQGEELKQKHRGQGPLLQGRYHSRMTSPAFPATSSSLMLAGPAGQLEIAVDPPEADTTPLPLTVILCHPLSTEGGSLNNKVVTMAARSLRELGAGTVRFNFRGVGKSEGNFDHGEGEQHDLLAVVAWVREQRPDHDLWLAGFSFGAYVSLRAAHAVQPEGLISIAPPAGRWDFRRIAPVACPWLVIQGDEDEIVDPQAVYDWIATLKRKPDLVRMPDTSHFFHRKLIDLRGALQHGVKNWLPIA